MRHQSPTWIILAAALTLVVACEREERRFAETPPSASPPSFVTVSQLQPGPTYVSSAVEGPYGNNAFMTSEGKRLFAWMNCTGCHANGGGSIGPALMDDQWAYGSEPQQIFASIAEGRPNGMPSFKYKLGNQQIWQLVAYVRSLSSLTPKGARGGRDDHMMIKPAEAQTPTRRPKMSTLPAASTRP